MILDYLDAHINLISLFWLFPITFMFHDFEEILTIEKWIQNNRETVQRKLPLFAQKLFGSSFRMNTLNFATDVFWVYVLIVVVTVSAVFFDFYLLFLATLHLFFIHVFTHVGQAIYLRMYTPGVITSIVLVLPYSIYAYYRLFSEQIITMQDIIQGFILLLILLPVGLYLLLKGRKNYVQA